LATDEKLPLNCFHISCQNLEISREKCQFRTFKVIFRGQKAAEFVQFFFFEDIKLEDKLLLM
jgi:hypothetical protein